MSSDRCRFRSPSPVSDGLSSAERQSVLADDRYAAIIRAVLSSHLKPRSDDRIVVRRSWAIRRRSRAARDSPWTKFAAVASKDSSYSLQALNDKDESGFVADQGRHIARW